jgi:hypothetical protein
LFDEPDFLLHAKALAHASGNALTDRRLALSPRPRPNSEDWYNSGTGQVFAMYGDKGDGPVVWLVAQIDEAGSNPVPPTTGK